MGECAGTVSLHLPSLSALTDLQAYSIHSLYSCYIIEDESVNSSVYGSGSKSAIHFLIDDVR